MSTSERHIRDVGGHEKCPRIADRNGWALSFIKMADSRACPRAEHLMGVDVTGVSMSGKRVDYRLFIFAGIKIILN